MRRAVLAAGLCLLTMPWALAGLVGKGNAAPSATAMDDNEPVGSRLPPGIELQPVPPRYSDGYEEMSGYSFAIAEGHGLLVETASRRIVAALP